VPPIDPLTPEAIEAWLRCEDAAELERLWAAADRVRRESVGDEVHLRGLIEVSNHCVRSCAYCGINAGHAGLQRYRMAPDEVLACAREGRELGYGTVVLQAGEDYGLTREGVAGLVRAIKEETGLAVTLSLGERPDADLAAWRAAGADRYLLRFETSNQALYRRIHPDLGRTPSDRFAILRRLRALGYEVGSGVMAGIPGQTWADLVQDLLAFRGLDLDMIGIGPYLAHPGTELGREAGAIASGTPGQAPGGEAITYRLVALARLLCPHANIPSTTALATVNKARGRELGLQRGANIVMPNLTPPRYRALYEIYPAKACVDETARACHGCLAARIRSIGRVPGQGPGSALGNRTRLAGEGT
jgi:biotin synthase